MPCARRHQAVEQGAADLEELLAAGDGAVEAPGAGDDPEILIFDLERDGAPGDLLFGDSPPDGLADPVELGGHRALVGQVGHERVLGADRLVGAVGLDLAVADAAGEVVIIFARAAEIVGEEGEALGPEVGAGDDAEPRHLLRRLRADAVEALDRQRGDEGLASGGRDDAEAVGLVLVRGELGEELVVGDAGRGGERRSRRGSARGSPRRSGWRCRSRLQILGDVEIGLVEAERLDQRRIIGEDRADLPRDLAIGVEARLDEDELGAAPLRASPRAWPSGRHICAPRSSPPRPRRARRRRPRPAGREAPDCRAARPTRRRRPCRHG